MQRVITDRAGFTIIEVMLVLAISGSLVAGLLVGTGVSINIQRYRDSVVSLHTTLQNQYNRLTSVENDRSDDWVCANGQVNQVESGGSGRGQTDCVILGRIVVIDDSTITSASVTGSGTVLDAGVEGDLATIKASYQFGIIPSSIETSQLEWNARLAWPAQGLEAEGHTTEETRHIALFFLRSPLTGLTYTFSSDTVTDIATIQPADIQAMIVPGEGQRARTLCINSNGMTFNNDLSLFIQANAASPGAIETSSDAILAPQGIQCQG